MTAVQVIGYLDGNYLTSPPNYLGGSINELTGMQVDLKPLSIKPTGMQSEMAVIPESGLGAQVELVNVVQTETGIQAEMLVQSPDDDSITGFQVEFLIKPEIATGMQAKIFPLQHWLHSKYLVDNEGYLEDSYLAEKMCAFQGMQVKMFVDSPADDHFQGMQVDLKVDVDKKQGMQVSMAVLQEVLTGIQVNMIKTFKLGSQANFVIYNDTQLRFLCTFPSRGTVAEYNGVPSTDNANWTTPQAMASGDLGKLKNLNSDTLEERIQSQDGVTASFELRSDAGVSNVFTDTIGIMEHNLTTSATVTFQGSDSPTFASVKFSTVLPVKKPNLIWVSPELPTLAAKYHRFLISDSTNPDNNIKIGAIIFGSADIFTLKECFSNPIRFGKTHFKDSIETEGFTNNSNDRATRKRLSLNFEKLNFVGGNYELLQDMMDLAKTDLKCLVIPLPQTPTRLSVFAKLTELPDEDHNADTADVDNHFVDIDLSWDESE